MASHRNEKVNGQIQRELSLIIIHKMKDARIKDSNVSITRVKATPDLKSATVYVSVFGDENQKKVVVELLNNAKSFLMVCECLYIHLPHRLHSQTYKTKYQLVTQFLTNLFLLRQLILKLR